MLSKLQKMKLLVFAAEDISGVDVSSALVPEKKTKAFLIAKEDCIVAGLEECTFLAKMEGIKFKILKKDGSKAKKNEKVAELFGMNRKILEIERTMLNVLGRMSGIATICKKASSIAAKKCKIYLTRKTTPGLNEFEKKACLFGGVYPHRKNLNEMILLKPNHLLFFNSLEDAVAKAEESAKSTKAKIFEVEAKTVKEAVVLAKLNVPWIMLDNFSIAEAKKAIKEIRNIAPKTVIECSGGINLSNLHQYIALKPDIISMGYLTKSAGMVDFSMKVVK